MKAIVVYNPSKVDAKQLEKALLAAQPSEWEEPGWLETAEDDAGEQAAKDALAAGADLILVAGGDGTVRTVSEVLVGSGVPMALLPSGTGNLLARNLGIDVTFLRASMRNAFEGIDRDVDIAWVEIEREDGSKRKLAFTVMAGFGLDAAMIEETDDTLKKRVGWLAYIDAFARAFQKIDRVRMRYRVDGGRQQIVGVNTLIVGNCGALQGNVVLLPDARIDDGKLDIAIVRPEDALGWLQVIRYIVVNSTSLHRALRRKKLIGPQKKVPTLGYGQATEVQARIAEPRTVQVDGDPIGEAVAMRFTVQPGALRVRVPD